LPNHRAIAGVDRPTDPAAGCYEVIVPDHPHHEVAFAWLQHAMAECETGGSIEILPMVAAGLLRLATNPKVFVSPTPIDAAIAFVDSILATPHPFILRCITRRIFVLQKYVLYAEGPRSTIDRELSLSDAKKI
jgi:predicted nucleic acid-binding protein